MSNVIYEILTAKSDGLADCAGLSDTALGAESDSSSLELARFVANEAEAGGGIARIGGVPSFPGVVS